MKIWNFGIIGAGLIADFHAKAIQTLPNAKLIGVSDAVEAKAQALAAKYSCKAFAGNEEILRSADIDIIAIVTPSGAHMEPAIEAARNGKHVICEKPLARSVKSCLNIKHLQEETGLVVLPAHNYVFTPCLNIVQNLVHTGAIGDVAELHATFENNLGAYKSKDDFRLKIEFGLVEDLLPHILSVANELVGAAKAVVDAKGWKQSNDVIDNLNLLLETDKGIEVDCFTSWTSCFDVVPRTMESSTITTTLSFRTPRTVLNLVFTLFSLTS